jgi:outer membrane receptor protein involved in Fe transport
MGYPSEDSMQCGRNSTTEKSETYTYRLGLRHTVSPSSILLGSLTYQHRDNSIHDNPVVSVVSSIDDNFPDQTALSGEAQHLFRSKYINTVSCIGYFKINAQEELTVGLNLPPPPTGPGPTISMNTIDSDVKHFNLYVYSYLSLLKNVTFTLGESGDLFDTDRSDTEKTNQFNPKFGLVWNVFPDTTVRAAVFRALKRTLITDQTLEPTQVAGFNQFFDDFNATKSWRYGVAIDQKFPKDIFGGVEFSKRDLSIPFLPDLANEVRRGDGNEYLGRAYLFWTPHPWLVLGAEYQYEQFERDEDVAFSFKEVTTHRVPLGLRLFHPLGVSAALKATYFNQKGDFIRRDVTDVESGEDDFWVVDAAISYRLPKRYGFITLGATNLFNQDFKFQETDLRSMSIQPDRFIFARMTLALP